MANLLVKDGAAASKYLKTSGAGDNGDPHIPEHLETNSAAIKTAVETIDNAIAGNEMQVDIVGALPAGTNAIGKLAANSGVDIGDVDVTSIAAGENHLGEVGGNMVGVSVELTRPADTTAYAAGDVVADSTSAATLLTLSNAVRVNAGSGYIVRCSVTTDKKSITPRFRVHFFNASNPTIANDNVAYKELYADAGKRLGYVDLPAMTTAVDTTNSDMSRAFDNNLRLPIVAAASTRHIYALLETLDAFTPASGEKFTLMILTDCN